MAGLVTLKTGKSAFPPFDSDDPLLLVDVACDSEAELTAAGFTFPEAGTVTCVAGSGFKFDQQLFYDLDAQETEADEAEFSINGTVSFKISRHCLENKAVAVPVWTSDRAFTQTGGMQIVTVYDGPGAVSLTRLYNSTAASTAWIFRHEAQATNVLTLNAYTADGTELYYDQDYARVTITWSGKRGQLFIDSRLIATLAYTDALANVRNIVAFGSATLCPHDAGASDLDPVYIKDIQISMRPSITSGSRRTGMRVAFFGDSTVERGGNKGATNREYGFMEECKARFRAIGMDMHYFNHGQSGHVWSETRSPSVKLSDHVAAMLADKPDIVVCQMSVNDMYDGAPTADLKSSIEAILTTINADPNVQRILLLSNPPMTQGDPTDYIYCAGGSGDATAFQNAMNVVFNAVSLPAKAEKWDMWTMMGGHDADVKLCEGARGYESPNSTQIHQTRYAQMVEAKIIFDKLLSYINAM